MPLPLPESVFLMSIILLFHAFVAAYALLLIIVLQQFGLVLIDVFYQIFSSST